MLPAIISLQIGIVFRDDSIIKYARGVKLLIQSDKTHLQGLILEINISSCLLLIIQCIYVNY